MTSFGILVALAAILVVSPEVSASVKLSSSHPSVSDGPCNFPQEVATNANIFELYDPFQKYYIPRGSKAFYRTLYEILHNGESATSEAQLEALRPRAQFLTLRVLGNLGDLEITFDDNPDVWYGYQCIPSELSDATIEDPLIPFLNDTCTLVAGSKGVLSDERLGTVYLTAIWSDETAVNVWGCFKGQQSFHMISETPELTQEQIDVNDKLLSKLGFDKSHAMNLKYPHEEEEESFLKKLFLNLNLY